MNIGRAFVRKFSTSLAARADLEVTRHGKVAHVVLNRPDRRNTFTIELWQDMKKAFDELSVDPKVRSIVLSANGKSYCAGIDLQMGMGKLVQMIMNDEFDVGRKARYIERIIQEVQDGFTCIEKCPKPVITAIHSHCVGAGIDLIAACDIRYASQDAIFNIKEVDIGMAADVGTLNRLPHVVGNDSWLRELSFTARDFGANEALQHGLISRIFATKEECVDGALQLAENIAEKSPIGVQGTKKVLNYSRGHTVDESLEFVKIWNMSMLQSFDLMESAMAAMNKKKVDYKDV